MILVTKNDLRVALSAMDAYLDVLEDMDLEDEVQEMKLVREKFERILKVGDTPETEVNQEVH